MTRSFIAEVDQLIRARYTLLYVLTHEEYRARKLLAKVAEKQQKALFEWSVTDGLRAITGTEGAALRGERQRDAMKVLNEILQTDVAGIYILKDFHAYLEAPEIIRQLRDLGEALRKTRKSIVILAPKVVLPQELEKSITILDLPLPTTEELHILLKNMVNNATQTRNFKVNLNAEESEALVKAARGLTMREAENAFAKSVIRDRKLDGGDVQAVMEEKRQIIRKSGLLEFYPAEDRMDDVGGMDLLKEWLKKRVRAFSKEARAYGLPAPRGLLLMGVQGCGKSLIAKSIASTWRMPLLRMDMSRIFQGYIGSSEENMRRALQMTENLSPMVLWIDEIEKAFSGIEGSSATDAGTTARVIGQFLTWMQEKQAPVFVVATANSVEGLPPELLRKGRLDEIFFVDLPCARERLEIFRIHLRRLKRNPEAFELRALVEAADGFSGAEIEQALISALHDSFFAQRDLETQDVLTCIGQTVPLSRTMHEKVDKLRSWATDRARPVSSLQVPRV